MRDSTAPWLLAVAVAVAADRPPRSLVPRAASLVPDHVSVVHDAAEASLHAGRHRVKYNRRRNEELTTDNTNPIRLAIDFDSLYEETAPTYSACFAVGAWFARGLPDGGPEPPADGVATCVRDENEWSSTDCWGKCTEEDLITAEGRNIVIGIVNQVASELSNFFGVEPVDGALTFAVSEGRYAKALVAKGYEAAARCAADCTYLNGVAVADAYCTSGVAADAVLSITKPATIAGVGGTGGSCATDTRGRPTWLVFAWIQSIATLSGSVEDHLATYRGLVLHELIHALGFSNSMFNLARDASGNLKQLLSLVAVDDFGADPDEVWHFQSGRAYEAAQLYFNCADEAQWAGLPLMGAPELGRASHWETRIMRDDVMSYGGMATVSSVTLAAMEDLGFYLANYSAAQCMFWGHNQGCNYVATRCGATIDDRLARPGSPDDCEGNPFWAAAADPLLSEKCEGGSTPCDSLEGNGYIVEGGERKCNSQCFTGARTDCAAAPASAVEGSGESTFAGLTVPTHWLQYLWLGVIALGGLMAVGICRDLFCPRNGSKFIMGAVSMMMVVLGVALAGVTAVALFDVEVQSTLTAVAVEVEGFLDLASLYVLFAIGAVLLAIGLATLCGMSCRSRLLLLFVMVFWVLLLLTMFAISAFLAYWITTLDEVTSDQLATLQGTSSGVHSGKFGAAALAEVEGFVCRTYQTCCRDPALDLAPLITEVGSGDSALLVAANRTCLQSHEGVASDIAITMDDPSKENFCVYLTGSSVLDSPPPESVCLAIDVIFPLSQCQANYCLLGAEGYFDFVLNVVAFVREYVTWIGAGFSVIVLFQLVLIVNLFNLSRKIRKDRRVMVDVAGVEAKE